MRRPDAAIIDRVALVQTQGITLDGKPARITGSRLDYPIVRSATAGVEFSWHTVDRIAKSHKQFKS